MHPRAVLFDFDGVIADTENVHIVAWQRTLDRMGWELTDEAAAVAAEVDDRLLPPPNSSADVRLRGPTSTAGSAGSRTSPRPCSPTPPGSTRASRRSSGPSATKEYGSAS